MEKIRTHGTASKMDPMRPCQVRDILENLQRCHAYLAHYYFRLYRKSDESKRHEYRVLSIYERNLVQSLRNFSCGNLQGVLNSYVRFIEPIQIRTLEPRIQCQRPLENQPEDLDRIENEIQQLCLQLSSADTSPSVRNLFKNIAELELNRLRLRSQHFAFDSDL